MGEGKRCSGSHGDGFCRSERRFGGGGGRAVYLHVGAVGGWGRGSGGKQQHNKSNNKK